MPTALTKSAEDALALFRHHDALAIANRKMANAALSNFLDAVTAGGTFTGSSETTGRVPKCVTVWTSWLAEHGPNTRQHITEATRCRFTEAGTPHTIKWEKIYYDGESDIHDDDLFPQNTIIRFRGKKVKTYRSGVTKTGAAPVIFALWSQRYDVLPVWGVGPERPLTPQDVYDAAVTRGLSHAEAQAEAWPEDPEAMTPMLGVIQPPVKSPYSLIEGPWAEQALDYTNDAGEIHTTPLEGNDSDD